MSQDNKSNVPVVNKDVSIYAVGDVTIRRDNPESIFSLCSSKLKEADIRFCQLESVMSSRGIPSPGAGGPFRVDPKNIAGLTYAGFDVVSANGNHCLDWGYEAFDDTLTLLKDNGIQAVGAGKDILEARKPVIIERNNTKIAFLSYNSIMRPGYWADKNRAGCAPMRVHTFTELIEIDQPGTPCRVHTMPNRDDLAAMKDDITKAKLLADIVVVSLHFGIHFIRACLAEYQPEVCYAAIDAGADVILGHHPHILKAIEIYKEKVIFYSLGNFAFDAPIPKDKNIERAIHQHMFELYGLRADPDDPLRTIFPADSRKTIIAKIVVRNKKIYRVSFFPALANKQNQSQVMTPDTEEFHSVVKYVQEITQEAGIKTEFTAEGDEVLIR